MTNAWGVIVCIHQWETWCNTWHCAETLRSEFWSLAECEKCEPSHGCAGGLHFVCAKSLWTHILQQEEIAESGKGKMQFACLQSMGQWRVNLTKDFDVLHHSQVWAHWNCQFNLVSSQSSEVPLKQSDCCQCIVSQNFPLNQHLCVSNREVCHANNESHKLVLTDSGPQNTSEEWSSPVGPH